MVGSTARRALCATAAAAALVVAASTATPGAAQAAGPAPAIVRVTALPSDSGCGGYNVAMIGLNATQIGVGQRPGRQFIAYFLRNGVGAMLIVVDDAPGHTRDQMLLTLDIDPLGPPGTDGVTWSKEIEAAGYCHSAVAARVDASMRGGFGVGSICRQRPASSASSA